MDRRNYATYRVYRSAYQAGRIPDAPPHLRRRPCWLGHSYQRRIFLPPDSGDVLSKNSPDWYRGAVMSRYIKLALTLCAITPLFILILPWAGFCKIYCWGMEVKYWLNDQANPEPLENSSRRP